MPTVGAHGAGRFPATSRRRPVSSRHGTGSARRRGRGDRRRPRVTTEAGAAVLAAGGNACDALVGAGLASWVAEPTLTGPCGGGFLCTATRRAGASPCSTSSPPRRASTAPRRRAMDAWDVEFGTAVQRFWFGVGSCAVPGTAAVTRRRARRWGAMPWAALVAPAIAPGRRPASWCPSSRPSWRGSWRASSRRPRAPATCSRLPARSCRPATCSPAGARPHAGAPGRARGRRPVPRRPGRRGRALLRRGGRLPRRGGPGGVPRHLASAARRPLPRRAPGHDQPAAVERRHAASATRWRCRIACRRRPIRSALDAARTLAVVLREAERRRTPAFAQALRRGGARRLLDDEHVAAAAASVARELAGAPEPVVVGHSPHGTTHISVVDARGNAAAMTCSTGCGSGVFVGRHRPAHEQHAGRGGPHRRPSARARRAAHLDDDADAADVARRRGGGRRLERLGAHPLGAAARDHGAGRSRLRCARCHRPAARPSVGRRAWTASTASPTRCSTRWRPPASPSCAGRTATCTSAARRWRGAVAAARWRPPAIPAAAGTGSWWSHDRRAAARSPSDDARAFRALIEGNREHLRLAGPGAPAGRRQRRRGAHGWRATTTRSCSTARSSAACGSRASSAGPSARASSGTGCRRRPPDSGVTTAAVGQVCALAFGPHDLHRVQAATRLDNGRLAGRAAPQRLPLRGRRAPLPADRRAASWTT